MSIGESEHPYDLTLRSRPVDQLQRMVVLSPVVGACENPEEIRIGAQLLREQRLRRLQELDDLGWRPCRDRRYAEYVRNCPSPFVYTKRRRRPCNVRWQCPFCYAREVGQVYHRICEAFHSPLDISWERGRITARFDDRGILELQLSRAETLEFKPSFDFVAQVLEFRVSYANGRLRTCEAQAQDIMRDEVLQRQSFVKAVRPDGAYCSSTIEPSVSGWVVKRRRLLMLTSGTRIRGDDGGGGNGTFTHRHKRPSMDTILSAVARVLRYPTGLLLGDGRMTVALCRARQSGPQVRLAACVGRFRRRRSAAIAIPNRMVWDLAEAGSSSDACV